MKPRLEVTEMVQMYRDHECQGIAEFLVFLQELEEDERTEILQLTLTKLAGVRPTKVEDAFVFFSTLFDARQSFSPFIDEGVKLLDMACGQAAEWWKQSETGMLQ